MRTESRNARVKDEMKNGMSDELSTTGGVVKDNFNSRIQEGSLSMSPRPFWYTERQNVPTGTIMA